MIWIDVADGDDFSIFDADHIVTAGFGDDVGALVERLRNYMKCVVMTESLCDLTLICPGLFKHISKDQGVWVELGFFGNDLLWNDLPYSKGFMRTIGNGHRQFNRMVSFFFKNMKFHLPIFSEWKKEINIFLFSLASSRLKVINS